MRGTHRRRPPSPRPGPSGHKELCNTQSSRDGSPVIHRSSAPLLAGPPPLATRLSVPIRLVASDRPCAPPDKGPQASHSLSHRPSHGGSGSAVLQQFVSQSGCSPSASRWGPLVRGPSSFHAGHWARVWSTLGWAARGAAVSGAGRVSLVTGLSQRRGGGGRRCGSLVPWWWGQSRGRAFDWDRSAVTSTCGGRW